MSLSPDHFKDGTKVDFPDDMISSVPFFVVAK